MAAILEPYTKAEPPDQKLTFGLKPKLVSWTSRVWRESRDRALPLLKLDARLDPRDIEDRDLSQALRPHAASLANLAIYVLHGGELPPITPWAVGRFAIDADRAYMFFDNFMLAPNGQLMLSLLQTAGAASDIIISVIPVRSERKSLDFAITDYDFGIHNRIG